MTTELLVVGSVAFDTIHTIHGSVDEALGGSATYFSIAASHFVKPSLVAVVGDDFPEAHTQLLKAHITDLDGLEVAEGKTFRWGGRYLPDMAGRETLFTHLNVFEHFSPKVPEMYLSPKTLFLANIDPVLQQEVLQSVERPSFVACDTMNYWIEGPRKDALLALLPQLDCLIINDEEATLLTGETNPVTAGPLIQAMGPHTLIVKKGPHGMLLFHGDTIFTLPAMPLSNVVDPTGAGDSFAGGFMGYLTAAAEINATTLQQATIVGTLLASYCVQGFGVEKLVSVTPEDLQAQWERFQACTQTSPLAF